MLGEKEGGIILHKNLHRVSDKYYNKSNRKVSIFDKSPDAFKLAFRIYIFFIHIHMYVFCVLHCKLITMIEYAIHSAKFHVFAEYHQRKRILIEYLGDVRSQGGKYANFRNILSKPKRVQTGIIRDRLNVSFSNFLYFLYQNQ